MADGGLLRLSAGDVLDGDGGQGAVVQHVFVVEQVKALEHHADALAQAVQVGVQVRQVLAAEPDVAAVRLLQQVQAAKQRGLAGAGGADDAHHLALLHVQVDALEDLQGAKGLFQSMNGKNRFRGLTSLVGTGNTPVGVQAEAGGELVQKGADAAGHDEVDDGGGNFPQPDTGAVCPFSEKGAEKQIHNGYFALKLP